MAAPVTFATTVLGLDWYIVLFVLIAVVVLGAFALSAAGLWKLGALGRRGGDRAR
ncbi:MAG: hypothetical protein M3N04_03145 [Actinomycetota bacterium]|nr:hypothetical protein [Actinomycetota bacterium]